jgi:tetratricopeptide (TPR) repeat protein
MQLDLFSDNRPTILLNIVDEYLQARQFDKALSTCRQVVEEYPDNRSAADLGRHIQMWSDRISGITSPSCLPQHLDDLLTELGPATHAALRTAVVESLLRRLQAMPEAERIFIPPRFHCGHLLLDLGRYDEAAASFRQTISASEPERGRFLAWSADAMTLAGNADDALNIYLQAFLEDPASVDMAFVKHPGVQKLHRHCSLNAEGIDDDGEASWLPVWGWFHGVFSLPLHNPPDYSELLSLSDGDTEPLPRLWHKLLTRAEYLRTFHRDDTQRVSVRRIMKRMNAAMFDCYMQRIQGIIQ